MGKNGQGQHNVRDGRDGRDRESRIGCHGVRAGRAGSSCWVIVSVNLGFVFGEFISDPIFDLTFDSNHKR